MIKFIDMFSGIGGFREGLTRAKRRWVKAAAESMISPAAQNLIPAKSILDAVISEVIINSCIPSLISGYAHPQRMAAVSANTATHKGC